MTYVSVCACARRCLARSTPNRARTAFLCSGRVFHSVFLLLLVVVVGKGEENKTTHERNRRRRHHRHRFHRVLVCRVITPLRKIVFAFPSRSHKWKTAQADIALRHNAHTHLTGRYLFCLVQHQSINNNNNNNNNHKTDININSTSQSR